MPASILFNASWTLFSCFFATLLPTRFISRKWGCALNAVGALTAYSISAWAWLLLSNNCKKHIPLSKVTGMLRSQKKWKRAFESSRSSSHMYGRLEMRCEPGEFSQLLARSTSFSLFQKLRLLQCRPPLQNINFQFVRYFFWGWCSRCCNPIYKSLHRELIKIELFFKSVKVEQHNEENEPVTVDVDCAHCDRVWSR